MSKPQLNAKAPLEFYEAQAWGSSGAADYIRLLRNEVAELKAILWMAAYSSPLLELRIDDIAKHAYHKEDCRIESHDDKANRCTIIKAAVATAYVE